MRNEWICIRALSCSSCVAHSFVCFFLFVLFADLLSVCLAADGVFSFWGVGTCAICWPLFSHFPIFEHFLTGGPDDAASHIRGFMQPKLF